MALGLRAVAADRNGAALARRPRSRVVHIVPPGPLTPSGRFLPLAARTVANESLKRLQVEFTPLPDLQAAGLRFCRHCTATSALPPSLGVAVQIPDVPSEGTMDDFRDAIRTAYGHLTPADLLTAARWCRTVEECHQLGTVASVLFGPAQATKDPVRHELENTINGRRRALNTAALSPEEKADRAADRDEELRQARLAAESRRLATAADRVESRAARGAYLMPHERDLIVRRPA